MRRKKSLSSLKLYPFVSALFLLAACLSAPSLNQESILPYLLSFSEKNVLDAKQILLVYEQKGFFSSRYYMHAVERTEKGFKMAFGPISAVIGKNGFAPDGTKREGDGRTPTGVYELKRAFGYNKSADTKMNYRHVLDNDIWIDDPQAPDYNQWTKTDKTTARSFENLKRKDDQYKYAVVIEYNTNPVIKDRGSAIFLHVWKAHNKPTAGCVAVSETDMQKILCWLDPAARPVIILGDLKETRQ